MDEMSMLDLALMGTGALLGYVAQMLFRDRSDEKRNNDRAREEEENRQRDVEKRAQEELERQEQEQRKLEKKRQEEADLLEALLIADKKKSSYNYAQTVFFERMVHEGYVEVVVVQEKVNRILRESRKRGEDWVKEYHEEVADVPMYRLTARGRVKALYFTEPE